MERRRDGKQGPPRAVVKKGLKCRGLVRPPSEAEGEAFTWSDTPKEGTFALKFAKVCTVGNSIPQLLALSLS